VHGCTARSVGARTRTFHIARSPEVATSSGYWPPPPEADTAFRKRKGVRTDAVGRLGQGEEKSLRSPKRDPLAPRHARKAVRLCGT